MTNLLITGGAGFLGTHLARAFASAGHQVRILDLNVGNLKMPQVVYSQGNILDVKSLEANMEDIDMVFHFAAIADHRSYLNSPLNAIETDLEGTRCVLKAAAKNRAKVIFASTSEIYGKNPDVPWREDALRVLGPTSINRWAYATAKAMGEHLCFAYGQEMNVPFVILRFFNAYGPGLNIQGCSSVIAVFLQKMIERKPIVIHGTGEQKRAFIYVDDVIRAVQELSFLKNAEGEIFNIGSHEEISMLGLAQLLKELGGFQSEIQRVSYEEAFGRKTEDLMKRLPDIEKVKRLIGWEPNISLNIGLRKTIDYFLT